MIQTSEHSYPSECDQFLGHKGQMKFLSSSAQFRACISGVRGGKTRVGCYETLLHMLRYPGITAVIVSPQITMMIRPGGPLEQLKEMIRWWEPTITIAAEDKQNHILTLSNGSRCLFVHCGDEDKLRGFECSVIFIDEAAYIRQEAYNILLGRMTQQGGFPHRLWICTTPRGHNWVYREFVEEKKENYEAFLWTTADNPAIDASFVENLKNSYGENSSFYAQEVLGSFVAFEGLVYHLQNDNLITQEPPLKEFDYIFGAIDWGSTAVCLVGGIHKADHNIYILNEIYTKDLILYGHPENNDFYTQVVNMRKLYGVELFWADPEDRNAIKTFQTYGLPIKRAKNKVLPGIREVTAKMPRIRIVAPNCAKLIYELNNYAWQEDRNLMDFKQDMNPIKQFDHACDALRYLIMGISKIDKSLYGN